MTLEEITNGLRKLLLDNNYNPTTIKFYEREWSKIHSYLIKTYGNTLFDMERGLAFLENQYSFQTKYNDGTLSQQRVQLLRVVHMLEDYRLHQVLTRRYYASKHPIKLNTQFSDLHDKYTEKLAGARYRRVPSNTTRPYLWNLWIISHKRTSYPHWILVWILVTDISKHLRDIALRL